jgi:hypothetical protein
MGNTVKRDKLSAETQERRRQALDLRKRGLTYPQIAKAMSVSLGTAHKLVQTAISDIPKELAEDVRLLELERLDRMLAGMWPKAIAGDPKAVAAAVKIMDRRAKYLGIDAPIKAELTGKDGGQLAPPLQIAIEAMIVLRDVALHGGQDGGARVMAARALLDRVAPEGRIEAPEPTPEWTPAQQADFEARHIDPEPEGDTRQ